MKNKTKFKRCLKYIVFTLFLLTILIYIFRNVDFSMQMILERTPRNSIHAAIVMFLLYAAKSATVFFPLIILEITVGYLFSTWTALGINFTGVLIILTVPYLIGKTAGMNTVQKMTRKYPKFAALINRQQESSLFLCFFLRIISCLPGDVVTMYLGATRTPYWENLFAGALGILPGMVLATLMGSSIQDPQSSAFWIYAALNIALAALSLYLYYLYRRRLQNISGKK